MWYTIICRVFCSLRFVAELCTVPPADGDMLCRPKISFFRRVCMRSESEPNMVWISIMSASSPESNRWNREIIFSVYFLLQFWLTREFCVCLFFFSHLLLFFVLKINFLLINDSIHHQVWCVRADSFCGFIFIIMILLTLPQRISLFPVRRRCRFVPIFFGSFSIRHKLENEL